MYEIKLTNGRTAETTDTYAEALAWVKAQGYEEVGHDGDLRGGGDRTLFWATKEDALDDDGARAAGSIYRIR